MNYQKVRGSPLYSKIKLLVKESDRKTFKNNKKRAMEQKQALEQELDLSAVIGFQGK